uniref:Uncharacterized protein n=1 Tax=Arion vulgaris TaxID=1028688 RepID=A0A0B7AY72_9EUPU
MIYPNTYDRSNDIPRYLYSAQQISKSDKDSLSLLKYFLIFMNHTHTNRLPPLSDSLFHQRTHPGVHSGKIPFQTSAFKSIT